MSTPLHWQSSSASGGTFEAVLTDVSTGLPCTQGSVIFAGSGGVTSEDNANFSFDDTANVLSVANLTILNGGTLECAGATGVIIGSSASKKIGFFGAAPVAQPSGASQAALVDSTGSTPSATLAAITAGGSYAQADIVAIKNAIGGIAVLVNANRTALLNLGLIKGAA